MKVSQAYQTKGNRPLIVCDFSPPRSGDPSFARDAEALEADFICVAYNPGKGVRLDSMAAAATIKRQARRDVIFNLSTRDMNKLALQSHLLGAQTLDVDNVLVLKGDDFTEKELARVKAVNDYTPTELLKAIRAMNEGVDFKGLKLRAPTALCPGATLDLAKGMEREARLAVKKVEAGAEFILAQSVEDAAQTRAFKELYARIAGRPIDVPVFWGVPVLAKDGIMIGSLAPWMKADLERGRDPVDIALDQARLLMDAGCDAFYVIPPILKGGARDYAPAAALIARLRAG